MVEDLETAAREDDDEAFDSALADIVERAEELKTGD